MNLPNKLTMMRIFLIPVFVAVIFITAIPCRFLIAAAIFAISSLTDLMDGRIARKRNLVTNFGKLMDPLADKVSVVTAILCIVCITEEPMWRMLLTFAAVIIIAREFLVTSLRLIAAGEGTVIAAAMAGKIKTTVQMIAIIVILLETQFSDELTELVCFPHWLGYIGLGVAVIATVVSGVQYMNAYKSYIDPRK